jgi:biotin carboxyl carrier protein
VDDPGLLRIKNENGVMTLDLDGERVSQTALNAEQRKRLIEMLNVMRPWLEGKPASVPAPTSPPPPKPTPASATATSAPPQSTSAARPTPSTSNKKKDEPEAIPTSIVGQINMVLQKNIVHTPLASRGISLMESVTGGHSCRDH